MVYLIGTPIGNIKDISLRALEILESIDYILCEDTRVSKKLIHLLHSRGILKKIDFTFISMHSHNEKMRLNELGSDFFRFDIAFLSDAGMPAISDPGATLVRFMQEHNLAYTIISGACSVTSAFALCGFDGGFEFGGFLPHKLRDKKIKIAQMLDSPTNQIFFESPFRLAESLEILAESAPKRAAFFAKEISKMHERLFFGSIEHCTKEILKSNLNGEWVGVLRASEESSQKSSLNFEEILNLDLPPKIKAKILSKISPKSTQEIYDEIIK